ncbi:SchA/CurD-like domain-containing protein [Kitasatospora aureofaciens]|uniref:SchA/CurD-like domain-containing protein n=1 Tax=Kitasatospora aureofaciens TaxID=1894 RepID=UPI001C45E637|nr:SchA/CurD-like domain-containing protein [Kitasatospora aureofaciens]MBV6696701.1 hypothetical protein [Kitasatospora aureofaciens]
MAFIAISYRVRPGHEEEIAEIFAEGNFRRADSAEYRDEQGRRAGRNVSTGLFIEGELMTRVVQFEGDLRQIGRHMGGQQGVKEAERKLSPFLQVPRDTETVEGFQQYFQNALMTCVFQEFREERSAQLAAWAHRIQPGAEDGICEVFERVQGEVLSKPAEGGDPLIASAAFIKDDYLVWAVQYDGEFDGLARRLVDSGLAPRTEDGLRPFLAGGRDAAGPERFGAAAMRRLQMLSAGVPGEH